MSKYEPLEQFLAASNAAEIALTFEDIERILARDLPRSAFTYREWWANTQGSHVQAKAWMSAGYLAEDVDMDGKRLVFRRWQDQRGQKKEAKFQSFREMMDATEHLRSKVTFVNGFDPTTPSQKVVETPEWS